MVARLSQQWKPLSYTQPWPMSPTGWLVRILMNAPISKGSGPGPAQSIKVATIPNIWTQEDWACFESKTKSFDGKLTRALERLNLIGITL